MAITVNIYYSGKKWKCKEICRRIAELREKYNLHMKVERYIKE